MWRRLQPRMQREAEKVLSELFVLPRGMGFLMSRPKVCDVDMTLRYPAPQAVVRIWVLEARDVPVYDDDFIFDTSVSMRLGLCHHTTTPVRTYAKVDDKISPEWADADHGDFYVW